MELTLPLPEGAQRVDVTGPAERNLKIIREALSVRLAARDATLRLLGDPEPVRQAAAVLKRLTEAARHRKPLTREQLLDALAAVAHTPPPTPAGDPASAGLPPNGDSLPPSLHPNHLDVYLPGRSVRPVTPGQRAYLRSILEHDLTFCFGPAGTGKTYLAVAAAAALLKKGLARKLVLVRPAVEAGEKLGFLPGTMQDKVNPYLRPLLDALHDMMDYDQVQRFMAADLIEIVPLAFMRGRTLNDAVIILDEAQNTTKAQMLMFLTRLGHGSRMVVTGDTSQTDLPNPNDSGLVDAVRKLQRTPGIGRIVLSGDDIVRHSLVQRIVEAYGQPKAAPQHLPDDLDANPAAV
ncbi:MAG: PhoH family protein [Planctomycetota bacterium]